MLVEIIHPAPPSQTVKDIQIIRNKQRRQEMRQLTMFFGPNTVAKWVVINHAKLFSTSVLLSPCSIFASCERHPSSEIDRHQEMRQLTMFFGPNTVAKWVIINHAKLFSTSALSSPCAIFGNCERHPTSEINRDAKKRGSSLSRIQLADVLRPRTTKEYPTPSRRASWTTRAE